MVIPCHEPRAAELPRAILSVANQTMAVECLVVNDGASEAVTRAAGGVSVLDTPRIGQPAAVNLGVRRLGTDFFVRLDADDEMDPTFVERTLPEMEVPHCAAAVSGFRLYGALEETVVPPQRVSKAQKMALLTRPHSIPGMAIVRTKAWASVGGYDESLSYSADDWEFWIRLVKAGWEIRGVNEILWTHYLRPDKQEHRKKNRDNVRAMLKERHPDLEFR